ncbi:small-conductance mechanosensitive channel [Synechococcus sp. PCC 7502]|uniref:mechanosensitive ion channel domain-containing protein n=1 Tax=Synechococcus sp. PCC 7502 TaxID=1173263 RepID=UPI00029FF05B|nr:mechanosensitive ion channel domain-containing protein [Synechococcus sp. PCC 7502]AFY73610.1 small-conductance mechanosensitive channel [Synechococcus sp. PCC 7502]
MINGLWLWAIALIIGFPVAVVLLGELIHRLQKQKQPFVATLQIIRNLVLPVLIFLLFTQHVLELPPQDERVRSIQTLLWICVIHGALSLLNTVLFEQAKADTWQAKVPKLLIDLSRLFLVLLGTAIVLATVWNADLAGLVTALGVSSIVIGLALQDTLGSVMSGIALLFEQPFSVGDWLKVGSLVGQVIDINWRSVRLVTLEREMVVIPHKVISGEVIRNFSRPQRIHAERVQVGFSYKDPPNLAKYVLKNTALETQGILANPEPYIFTLGYSDSSITYEVKFFIEDYADLEEIRDRFMTRVWYAAQRNNLNIPFPIRTLYHFHGPTSQAEGSKKFAQSLDSIPAFVPLERDYNLRSPDINLQHFGAGENVIQQGYPSSALYIVIVGIAVMTVVDPNGDEHEVLQINPGEFFGEMTLFSGEVSMITVRAKQDLELMMISANEVDKMIERQPSFSREISQVLEIRRRALNNLQKSIQPNLRR